MDKIQQIKNQIKTSRFTKGEIPLLLSNQILTSINVEDALMFSLKYRMSGAIKSKLILSVACYLYSYNHFL